AVTSITGTSHFAFILLCVFGLIALVTMFNLSKREKAAANKATVS
ncbi:MFS transporter, partial [Staphylococcus pseudintermedius]